MDAAEPTPNCERQAIWLSVPSFAAIVTLALSLLGIRNSDFPWFFVLGSVSTLGSLDGVSAIWRSSFRSWTKALLLASHLAAALTVIVPTVFVVVWCFGRGLYLG